jgi:uncharacterized protein YceK
MKRLLLILTACLLLAGCGDNVKLTHGGYQTSKRCINGYWFAVALADQSVALAQIFPHEANRCEEQK